MMLSESNEIKLANLGIENKGANSEYMSPEMFKSKTTDNIVNYFSNTDIW